MGACQSSNSITKGVADQHTDTKSVVAQHTDTSSSSSVSADPAKLESIMKTHRELNMDYTAPANVARSDPTGLTSWGALDLGDVREMLKNDP